MQLKLSGHETFYPRETWLYKGISNQSLTPNFNFFQTENKENEYPTDSLGVGVNQVKSIRFWVHAIGLTEKLSSNEEVRSKLAEKLLQYDPYLDKFPTKWILHYNLVTNENAPSVWKWFFCYSDIQSFKKDTFLHSFKEWAFDVTGGRAISERSMENDFSTLIGMYSPSEGKELFYPSPFYPCEILKYNQNVKRYYRNKNLAIPPNLLLYCLFRFRDKYFRETNILDLEHIRRIPESPLQVFGIDPDSLFDLFDRLKPNIQKKLLFQEQQVLRH